jgi:hypothetical protein
MNWRAGVSNNNAELISKAELASSTWTRKYLLNKDWVAIRQPNLSASTPTLRTDELIRYYGQDPQVRRTLSTSIWIKPEFAICLSQAETWVGKHLKTEHGYFNCWNTDSWRTMSFESLQHSFRGLGDLCLNWRYLSAKTTLAHLTPNHKLSHCSTNPQSDSACKYVYASSPENWWNNVISCLSNIHNKQIDMNFEFRLAI